jgi:hypothetical protein
MHDNCAYQASASSPGQGAEVEQGGIQCPEAETGIRDLVVFTDTAATRSTNRRTFPSRIVMIRRAWHAS